MVTFIDEHKGRFGVEPVCAKLLIAPTMYYDQCLRRQDSSKCGADGWGTDLIYHSDRGAQYLSIRKCHRLAATDIESSVGSIGDSHGNTLAEAIIGHKTELINRRRWYKTSDVEFATLGWIDWYNNRRLFGSIGYVPSSELEAEQERRECGVELGHRARASACSMPEFGGNVGLWRRYDSHRIASGIPGAVHFNN